MNSKERSLFGLRRVRSHFFVLLRVRSQESCFADATRSHILYAIAIPVLGIGTILIIVGLAGIIINWKNITGTIKEVGNVAVNWASDTVSDVTNRIINRFNNAGVAAPNIFEGLRGTIEDVVRNVFAARRGNTPGNN
ncbi:MAG: hypothetical protein AB1861_09970 [Cyanobacteriota bacterium]